ncbi:MAG: hypothetical protein M1832_004680 [Thelocarpon impressellum]|nr:MAG: hypothetical protein M1832_004680 [Thelocarpon impressellum]
MATDASCPAYSADVPNQYGYPPSLAAGITFCALFGVTTAVHVVQTVWKREWWTVLFSLGALTEVIGWAGRTWSAVCPYNESAFLMQISTLIIAPTFFTAGVYVVLGRLIQTMGQRYSPITPRLYLWIFCTCDVISLVVQAIGGGLASVEADKVGGDTKPGTNTMVAGIVFQMASISAFLYLFVVFLWRSRAAHLSRPLKLTAVATSASVAAIYVRSIYRTVELLQGWEGYLITREPYFVAFDGVTMVFSVAVFNVFHPSWLLRGNASRTAGTGGEKVGEADT